MKIVSNISIDRLKDRLNINIQVVLWILMCNKFNVLYYIKRKENKLCLQSRIFLLRAIVFYGLFLYTVFFLLCKQKDVLLNLFVLWWFEYKKNIYLNSFVCENKNPLWNFTIYTYFICLSFNFGELLKPQNRFYTSSIKYFNLIADILLEYNLQFIRIVLFPCRNYYVFDKFHMQIQIEFDPNY